jgi:hypothetical protein
LNFDVLEKGADGLEGKLTTLVEKVSHTETLMDKWQAQQTNFTIRIIEQKSEDF